MAPLAKACGTLRIALPGGPCAQRRQRGANEGPGDGLFAVRQVQSAGSV